MPAKAVLLFEDETILRLFPNLRRSWSMRSEQASIGISGHNARRVLFGTINIRTGHRVVMCHRNMKQEGFGKFLKYLRGCYRQQPICMLLDAGGLHTAAKSRSLAARLHVELIWLPKQCPELNGMDQLWRSVKDDISANRQFSSIDEHAQFAEAYIRNLTNTQALRKAGILSKNFWLKKHSCKN